MKPLKVGLVTEGPTDNLLLQELLNHLVGVEHHFLTLQPKQSETPGFGEYGGGWKGVRAWCQDYRTKHFQEIEKLQLDLLIIHLDADVAREKEIACTCPCPPAQNTCKALDQCVRNWLQIYVTSNLVLCLPADNMETWVLAAFDNQTPYHQPPEQPLECVEKPDMIISNQGYKGPKPLLKRKEGKPKKTKREYEENLVPVVLNNWAEVTRICPQAATFEQDICNQIKRMNQTTQC